MPTAHAPRDQHVFPFLDLPAELRVHIYRMALQRDDPLLLHLAQPLAQEANADPPARSWSSDADGQRRGRGASRTTTTTTTTTPTTTITTTTTATRVIMTATNHRETPPSVPDDCAPGLNPALLRTCSLIYKEARQVLYADNGFTLQLDSGIATLSALHQRSRSLIKHVSLRIPSHHDILDGFADLVRLGLRYCWGLRSFRIVLPDAFPDDRFLSGTTSVYANAFHILRWLPKHCVVRLDGPVNEQIRRVVEDEGRLQRSLDQVSRRP